MSNWPISIANYDRSNRELYSSLNLMELWIEARDVKSLPKVRGIVWCGHGECA